MNTIAKRHGKEKRAQADFDGKACWIGGDVHKVNYAVAILDEDGQRLEFSTPAAPKAFASTVCEMSWHPEKKYAINLQWNQSMLLDILFFSKRLVPDEARWRASRNRALGAVRREVHFLLWIRAASLRKH